MLFNKRAEGEFTGNLSRRPVTAVASAAESVPPNVRKTDGAPRSVIDAWLVINGNLESDGAIEVDGQIQGDVRCAHLTVGRHAQVTGNITADEVVVRGKVTGVIRANRVILLDTAQVDSEILHKTLSIEEGASFEGASHRREDPIGADVPGSESSGNGTYHAAGAAA
jgi:cytoskeletal protein CcmA (bactofilin family)